jgi:hypothetical protein
MDSGHPVGPRLPVFLKRYPRHACPLLAVAASATLYVTETVVQGGSTVSNGGVASDEIGIRNGSRGKWEGEGRVGLG